MIEIDGSMGEGGGQILRTSVAMSAVTGKPVKIKNIRSKRENPGLRPQHLTAINSVRKICDADLKGCKIMSSEIEFIPRKISGGRFSIDIGTAGSITLVLQALMIPAMFAEKPLKLRIKGGTDVRWSPSIDYLRFVAIPILMKFDYNARLQLLKRGYYPVGGGLVEIEIKPIDKLKRIVLNERGRILSVGGISHAHTDLEKARVAKRQMKSARSIIFNKLSNMDYDGDMEIEQEYVDADSYGSGITLWIKTENSVIGSDSLGWKGKRAELVGQEAANNLLREIDSDAPLDRYMGDQIIPYLALSGGQVRVSEITKHTRTNVDVMKKFGFDIRIEGNVIKV